VTDIFRALRNSNVTGTTIDGVAVYSAHESDEETVIIMVVPGKHVVSPGLKRRLAAEVNSIPSRRQLPHDPLRCSQCAEDEYR
jgi:hypothetical protein